MLTISGQLKTIENTLLKFERPFFIVLVLIHIIPLLFHPSFITVDGPAHLYNSRLIVDLLANDQTPLSDFFVFNQTINPNWTGHFLLSVLLCFLPPLVAEKILLICCVILLPIAFRYLFKQFHLKRVFLLYFIFPFTYSYSFYFGFFNFQLGIIALFFTVGIWYRYKDKPYNLKRVLVLISLSLLCYLTHLFSFALLLMLIGLFNSEYIILNARNSSLWTKETLHKLFAQLVIFTPGLLLTLIYLNGNKMNASENVYHNSSELWQMILEAQPAKGFNQTSETIFTKWIPILLMTSLVYSIVANIRKRSIRFNSITIIFGLCTLLMLTMTFVLPNYTASGGFISTRLIMLFYLFFIVTLATQKYTFIYRSFAFFMISYVSIALVKVYKEAADDMSYLPENIIAAAAHIEPYSTVLPISDNTIWIYYHAANYLGIDRPMIILDNYEASNNYFPLKWNRDKMPALFVGDTSKMANGFTATTINKPQAVDYILITTLLHVEEMRENEAAYAREIANHYKLIFESQDHTVRLYAFQN